MSGVVDKMLPRESNDRVFGTCFFDGVGRKRDGTGGDLKQRGGDGASVGS